MAVGDDNRPAGQIASDRLFDRFTEQDRADEDESIHLVFGEHAKIIFDPPAACADVTKNRLISRARQRLLNFKSGASVVRIANIPQNDPDGAHRLGDKSACNPARHIVVALEHRLHFLTGFVADVGFAVEHTGDGGDRDTGLLCHIIDVQSENHLLIAFLEYHNKPDGATILCSLYGGSLVILTDLGGETL